MKLDILDLKPLAAAKFNLKDFYFYENILSLLEKRIVSISSMCKNDYIINILDYLYENHFYLYTNSNEKEQLKYVLDFSNEITDFLIGITKSGKCGIIGIIINCIDKNMIYPNSDIIDRLCKTSLLMKKADSLTDNYKSVSISRTDCELLYSANNNLGFSFDNVTDIIMRNIEMNDKDCLKRIINNLNAINDKFGSDNYHSHIGNFIITVFDDSFNCQYF